MAGCWRHPVPAANLLCVSVFRDYKAFRTVCQGGSPIPPEFFFTNPGLGFVFPHPRGGNKTFAVPEPPPLSPLLKEGGAEGHFPAEKIILDRYAHFVLYYVLQGSSKSGKGMALI